MVVTTSAEHFSCSGSQKKRTSAFLMSVSSLVTRYTKVARRVSSKLGMAKRSHRLHCHEDVSRSPGYPAPKPPLAKPKHLLSQINNKAITFIRHRNRVGKEVDTFHLEPEDYGDGGVWQKTILMGDKCEPLDFSGVIHYDRHGKQLDEFPTRSPRASPLPRRTSNILVANC